MRIDYTLTYAESVKSNWLYHRNLLKYGHQAYTWLYILMAIVWLLIATNFAADHLPARLASGEPPVPADYIHFGIRLACIVLPSLLAVLLSQVFFRKHWLEVSPYGIKLSFGLDEASAPWSGLSISRTKLTISILALRQSAGGPMSTFPSVCLALTPRLMRF